MFGPDQNGLASNLMPVAHKKNFVFFLLINTCYYWNSFIFYKQNFKVKFHWLIDSKAFKNWYPKVFTMKLFIIQKNLLNRLFYCIFHIFLLLFLNFFFGKILNRSICTFRLQKLLKIDIYFIAFSHIFIGILSFFIWKILNKNLMYF